MQLLVRSMLAICAALAIPSMVVAQDAPPEGPPTVLATELARVNASGSRAARIEFAAPFAGAGRRELTAIGDAARLVYTLSARDGQPLPESGDVRFDESGISTSWLREELKRRFPTLEEVQTVTALSRREGSTDSVYSTEVRLELVGLRDAVMMAEKFLDEYVADNRRVVSIESVVTTEIEKDGVANQRDVQIDFLDRSAFDAFVVSPERRLGSEVTCAPTITAFGDQRAQIQVVNPVSYVKNWEIEVVRDQQIASPEIAVLNEGLMLELVPTIVGREVLLDIDLRMSKVQEIRSVPFKISLHAEPVQVDQPVVENVHWACSDAQLTEDAPVIRVRGLSIRDHDSVKKVDLLFRATIVDPSAEGDPVTIGPVIGFDPTTREAFLRTADVNGTAEIRARRIEILRDSTTVGHGTVIDVEGGFLRVRIDDGEAKAGDVGAAGK